jgi:hypothetical protein
MHRQCGTRGIAVRKAATTAKSQIAASAKRIAEYVSPSESSDEESTRKRTRSPITNTPHQVAFQEPEWYIAIDFGTSYTTVAWYRRGTLLDMILTIDNFPGERQHNLTNRQIPTEVWYPKEDARPFGHIKTRDIRMRFGNEVHRIAEDDEGIDYRQVYDETGRVTMMKLLLDNTAYAQVSKERLHETLDTIREMGHIEFNEDVFSHFFHEVLRATKTCLGTDFNGASNGMFFP